MDIYFDGNGKTEIPFQMWDEKILAEAYSSFLLSRFIMM